MENGRFILYIITLAVAFLLLAAIKMALPYEEPKEPIDEVGMKLYRPIFFGEPEMAVTSSTQEGFKDESVATATEKKIEKEVPTEEITKKPKPVEKRSLTGDSYFDEMIDEYKRTTLKERKYRNDVVVRYYKHKPDGDMAQILVDYGFYLHERPVSDQDEFENVMSNVIYYGKDFPASDLKLITYLLIKSGIEIKEVRRFKDFDGWKHEAIEIGASKYLIDDPTLTPDQIRYLFD